MQHLSRISTHHDQWINVDDAGSICAELSSLDKPSLSVSWVLLAMIQEVHLDYMAIFRGSDSAIIKAARYAERASIADAMMRMSLDGYSKIFTGAVVKGSELAGV